MFRAMRDVKLISPSPEQFIKRLFALADLLHESAPRLLKDESNLTAADRRAAQVTHCKTQRRENPEIQ